MNAPQASLLADGRRLHLNHGPIDLIIEAFGAASEVQQAYVQAVTRFQTILEELVEELTELRRPAAPGRERLFVGSTAKRMEAAVLPFATAFITPMAAVAGAVADEIMAAMTARRRLEKAYVNNGGDIALQIAAGQSLTVAIGGTGHGFADRVEIKGPKVEGVGQIRGVATSGWRGRSFSLGIADAVTVLARTAAEADAAATIIANAVDLPGHPTIARRPARLLQPDSDLGDRPVTVGVGQLTTREAGQALDAGCDAAEALLSAELIGGAALFLCGEVRLVGDVPVGPAMLVGGVNRHDERTHYPALDTMRSMHA